MLRFKLELSNGSTMLKSENYFTDGHFAVKLDWLASSCLKGSVIKKIESLAPYRYYDNTAMKPCTDSDITMVLPDWKLWDIFKPTEENITFHGDLYGVKCAGFPIKGNQKIWFQTHFIPFFTVNKVDEWRVKDNLSPVVGIYQDQAVIVIMPFRGPKS